MEPFWYQFTRVQSISGLFRIAAKRWINTFRHNENIQQNGCPEKWLLNRCSFMLKMQQYCINYKHNQRNTASLPNHASKQPHSYSSRG